MQSWIAFFPSYEQTVQAGSVLEAEPAHLPYVRKVK